MRDFFLNSSSDPAHIIIYNMFKTNGRKSGWDEQGHKTSRYGTHRSDFL